MMRKIARMHELFGVDACHKCGDCSNFVSGRYMSKILRNCNSCRWYDQRCDLCEHPGGPCKAPEREWL